MFGGKQRGLVLYITEELLEERGTSGVQIWQETYRARLIEQHLVRVNEKLC